MQVASPQPNMMGSSVYITSEGEFANPNRRSPPTRTIPCPECTNYYSSDASLRSHLRKAHTERRMLPIGPRQMKKKTALAVRPVPIISSKSINRQYSSPSMMSYAHSQPPHAPRSAGYPLTNEFAFNDRSNFLARMELAHLPTVASRPGHEFHGARSMDMEHDQYTPFAPSRRHSVPNYMHQNASVDALMDTIAEMDAQSAIHSVPPASMNQRFSFSFDELLYNAVTDTYAPASPVDYENSFTTPFHSNRSLESLSEDSIGFLSHGHSRSVAELVAEEDNAIVQSMVDDLRSVAKTSIFPGSNYGSMRGRRASFQETHFDIAETLREVEYAMTQKVFTDKHLMGDDFVQREAAVTRNGSTVSMDLYPWDLPTSSDYPINESEFSNFPLKSEESMSTHVLLNEMFSHLE